MRGAFSHFYFSYFRMAVGEFFFLELERQHIAVGRVYFAVVTLDRFRDLEVVFPARDKVSPAALPEASRMRHGRAGERGAGGGVRGSQEEGFGGQFPCGYPLVKVDGVVVVRLDVEVDFRRLVLLAGLCESVHKEPPPNALATVGGQDSQGHDVELPLPLRATRRRLQTASNGAHQDVLVEC